VEKFITFRSSISIVPRITHDSKGKATPLASPVPNRALVLPRRKVQRAKSKLPVWFSGSLSTIPSRGACRPTSADLETCTTTNAWNGPDHPCRSASCTCPVQTHILRLSSHCLASTAEPTAAYPTADVRQNANAHRTFPFPFSPPLFLSFPFSFISPSLLLDGLDQHSRGHAVVVRFSYLL